MSDVNVATTLTHHSFNKSKEEQTVAKKWPVVPLNCIQNPRKVHTERSTQAGTLRGLAGTLSVHLISDNSEDDLIDPQSSPRLALLVPITTNVYYLDN
eukprot:scaffold6314_cov273-Ochromonas_danica.AAC.26